MLARGARLFSSLALLLRTFARAVLDLSDAPKRRVGLVTAVRVRHDGVEGDVPLHRRRGGGRADRLHLHVHLLRHAGGHRAERRVVSHLHRRRHQCVRINSRDHARVDPGHHARRRDDCERCREGTRAGRREEEERARRHFSPRRTAPARDEAACRPRRRDRARARTARRARARRRAPCRSEAEPKEPRMRPSNVPAAAARLFVEPPPPISGTCSAWWCCGGIGAIGACIGGAPAYPT